MKDCERYQLEIEDFLYGELSERRAAEMRAHLSACADCAAVRDQIERENAMYAEFYEQTELEPTGEMWESIRARIQSEPPPVVQERSGSGGAWNWLWRPAVLRQLAFAIVLIVLSVSATVFILKRDGNPSEDMAKDLAIAPSPSVPPTPTSTVTPTQTPVPEVTKVVPPAPAVKMTPRTPAPKLPAASPAVSDESGLLRQQLARAEREYQSAVRLLDRAIAKRRDTLDPAMVKQYESSLALIDESIAQSRQALRQRPNDLSVGQFLLAAYAKKVELMQDIAMQ